MTRLAKPTLQTSRRQIHAANVGPRNPVCERRLAKIRRRFTRRYEFRGRWLQKTSALVESAIVSQRNRSGADVQNYPFSIHKKNSASAAAKVANENHLAQFVRREEAARKLAIE